MKLGWKAALGILVSVGLVWWTLKDVPFGDVWDTIRRGDLILLLAAVAVATAGFLIRAMRWKVLLHPLKPETSLEARFAATNIRFMANNILPARVGEFAGAYAFSRMETVTMSGAFGTLVVERFLDGLVLLSFLLGPLMFADLPGSEVLASGGMRTVVKGVFIVLFTLVVAIGGLLLWPGPVIRTAERVALRLPRMPARKIVDALEAFLEALEVLRRPALLFQAVAWSFFFWAWHGVSFWLGMRAFGIEENYPAALFTEAVVGFGVALPSSPGFFGTFHMAAKVALEGVYQVEPVRALAFAYGYHLGGFIPVTILGLWYARRIGLSLGDMGRSEEAVEAAVEAEHPQAAALIHGVRPGSEGAASAVAPGGRIAAPAKVNLFLRVLAREASGYHQVETLLQAVDLCDEVRVEVGGRGIELEVEGADVGPERDNLVWRAAAAYCEEAVVSEGLRLRLVKRVPAGAGLGGGSSDAGATLRLLNVLHGNPVPPERLLALAAELGSDVPFFLAGSPLALAWGRGDRLLPFPPLPEAGIVLALPDVHVDTAWAYGALAREREAADDAGPGPRAVHDRSGLDWGAVAGMAANDFEEVVAAAYPPVAAALRALDDRGARFASLSGSGGASFAVFRDASTARKVAERLSAEVDLPARFVATRTLSTLPVPELQR